MSSAGTGGEGSREYGGAGPLSVVGLWRGAATVSVGPSAFSPRPLPGLPRARPLTALVPSRAQRVPSYRTQKTRKPWLILPGVDNLGLSAFEKGASRSCQEVPLHCIRPLRSFLLLPFASSFFPLGSLRHLPHLFTDTASPPWSVAEPCSSGHHFLASGGGSIRYQKILYREGLKSNKLALLQLALMGFALSLLIRQLGEFLDLLVAF